MNSVTNLKNLFTEYDPDITGDTTLDGLGLRIIWSAHGYKIYNSYINTISNDVRNYTLNVLNHWVVRTICSEESIELNSAIGEFSGNKNTRAFKQACILFLENIYTYALVEAYENPDKDNKELSISGVLGSGNATRRWREDKNNSLALYLSSDDKRQILVRQFSLGVNGRYKAPLVNLKFFNDKLRYSDSIPGSAWYAVENDLAAAWPELSMLKDKLVGILSNLMKQSVSEPSISFADISNEIKSLYISNFTNSKLVGSKAKDFWLERTHLDKGVAGKIGEELKEFINSNDEFDLKIIYDNVLLDVDNAVERTIVNDIVVLEPFMEHLDLMFRLMCSAEVPNLELLEKKWKEYGREESSLPELAGNQAPNKNVLKGEAWSRIEKCIMLASASTLKEQAIGLEKYHAGLMRNRGQQAWIKILNNGDIQKNINAFDLPEKDDRYPGSWVHSYYAWQHLAFLRGLSEE